MLVELVRSAHLFVSLLAVLCATHGTLSEADVARSEDAADLEFVAESHSHLFTGAHSAATRPVWWDF